MNRPECVATTAPDVIAPSLKQRLGRALIPRLPITRFLFDQLRIEVQSAGIQLSNALFPSRRRRIRALRRMRGHYVNLASGSFTIPGFLNLDLHRAGDEVLQWDCRRTLPFADASVAGCRVEHFLEHLEVRDELPQFLAAVLRVLQPGAVLRVIVPDAERYVRAYCADGLSGFRGLGNPPVPFPADLPTRMDVLNHIFHQWHEHRWGYDFEALSHRLRHAGFRRVSRGSYGESLDPKLAVDREQHASYSLYVDAVK